MIDFSNIERYRENNRIEAKKALGGLPKSIWETYSAFANTLGGVILLGVEEYRDKSLHPVDLPDPDRLIKEFWEIINDPKKNSVNILSVADVTVEVLDGKHIIAITVPRAQRYDRPVFIEGNPMSGTYRRNGEGDYRCTKEEVQAMMRDASVRTQDMTVLDRMETDVFDYTSIHRYRFCMRNLRPGHVWKELDDTEFLYKLGAVGRGNDGRMHPTAAGLLMFGYENEIVKEYPEYFLDYREELDDSGNLTDRIVSSSGAWSGNIYDFYCRVKNKMTHGIKLSSETEDTAVHSALREAAANALLNADYHVEGGVVIVKEKKRITIANPGGFRIDIDDAKSGGVSDPRNAALLKMFNLIHISEGAGNGIPNIFNIWRKQGWKEPGITESFHPDRITLSLSMEKNSVAKSLIRGSEKNSAIKSIKKQMIIDYLTDNISAEIVEIADYIGLKTSRTRVYLRELTDEDIVVADSSGRSRIYRLKS